MVRLLPVLLVMALLAGACGAPADDDPDGSQQVEQDGADRTDLAQADDDGVAVADLAAGEWQALSEAPIDPRSNAVAVWTGTEVLFWGGFADPPNAIDNRMHDGAALDPTTGEWRVIADAPIDPDFQQTAIWTGREMLVYTWQGDGAGYSATPVSQAAYDPAADTWRPVADDPLGIAAPVLLEWTGDALLLMAVGVNGLEGAGELRGALYNPDADTWTTIAPTRLPGHLGGANAVWTGDRAIVWGGTETAFVACALECPEPVPANAEAAAYDPASDGWTELPDAPEAVREPAQPLWAGDRALVVGREFEGGAVTAYQPDDGTAEPIGHVIGGEEARERPLLATRWTGEALLSLAGQQQRYDEEFLGTEVPTDTPVLTGQLLELDGTATDLPDIAVGTATGQSVVWTSTSLVVWGGRQQAGAPRTTPAERARGAILVPRGGDTPPAPAPAADFTVTTGQAEGPDGVRVTLDSGTPDDPAAMLAHGGTLPLTITVEAPAGAAITGIGSILTAEEASGRLVILPEGCEAIIEQPQRGLQADCDGAGDTTSGTFSEPAPVPAGGLQISAATLTQSVPFAPTAGTYLLPVRLLVDGQAVEVAAPLTLEGISELGRVTHPLQREQRALLETDEPCAGHENILTNGVEGPGRLEVATDAVGWWGRLSFNARRMRLTLPDGGEAVLGELGVLMVDGVRLRECASSPRNAPVNEQTEGLMRSTLVYDGMQVEIIQEVLPPAADGSAAVRRTYRFTTDDPQPRTISLAHLADAAAVEDRPGAIEAGYPTTETAAVAEDGARLTESVGPASLTITGDLDGRTVPDRWAVASLDALEDRMVSSGGIPTELADQVSSPEGSVRYTPFSGTALAQQWDAVLSAQQPATLVLTATMRPAG
ncbi:hypothetical protein BH23ACT9_BH23ACT9_09190 [soil metagenome]